MEEEWTFPIEAIFLDSYTAFLTCTINVLITLLWSIYQYSELEDRLCRQTTRTVMNTLFRCKLVFRKCLGLTLSPSTVVNVVGCRINPIFIVHHRVTVEFVFIMQKINEAGYTMTISLPLIQSVFTYQAFHSSILFQMASDC